MVEDVAVDIVDLFGEALEYPDPDAHTKFEGLVGIDEIKELVVAEASLLLNPARVDEWSKRHHGSLIFAAQEVKDRTPLLIFAGDVGTGKTELAETFADAVARSMKIDITLFPISLAARGKGLVGQMTALLGAAFTKISDEASKAVDDQGRVRRGIVLLIDEADALAQSRELGQMHHEDRAGVVALIRGINQLRRANLPVLTVLCTNRIDAIDPAVRRRAAWVFAFERPNAEQRSLLFGRLLGDVQVSPDCVGELVRLTGANNGRGYGCTYSDLRQRLIPQAVLGAMNENVALTGERLVKLADTFEPTAPFGADQ